MTIGHCPHGEFELEKGCQLCILANRVKEEELDKFWDEKIENAKRLKEGIRSNRTALRQMAGLDKDGK